MADRALSDIKVIEFGNFIAGPYCTKLMADLGAEVIKIEEPIVGDEARHMGPFLGNIPHPERSGLFLFLNTNKKSITLNPKTATGKRIFLDLIKDADVLIENHRPSVMKELGLDYETLSRVNPNLIMTSISPFGQTGPYKDFKAYDLNVISIGGMPYINGGLFADSETTGVDLPPEGMPLKPAGHQAEFQGALNAAVATMMALWCRDSVGGQHIDISEQEAISSILETNIPFYSYLEVIRRRFDLPIVAPVHIIEAKDGHIYVLCIEEEQWKSFVEMMGSPDWANEEIFANRVARGMYADALIPVLKEYIEQHTVEELYHEAQDRGVPFAPVSTMADLLSSQHLNARGFFVDVHHPQAGKVRMAGAPWKLWATPWMIEFPAPLLGEHTEEIICGRLGYNRTDLAKMAEVGVV